MSDSEGRRRPFLFLRIIGIVIALIGLWLTGAGAYLLSLGGSLYYVLAGIGLLATAFLLFRRKTSALLVFAIVLAGTLIWALAEVGFDFWQLAPRGNLLVPVGVLLILPWLTRALEPRASAIRGAGLALSLALVASCIVLGIALTRDVRDQSGSLPAQRAQFPLTFAAAHGDWPAYAGTWAGLKYSPLAQVTPANVKDLQVAWHVHTGDLKRATDPGEFTYETTPIKVGNLLYLCTPHDMVIALDPVTGKTAWKFDPQVQFKGTNQMS